MTVKMSVGTFPTQNKCNDGRTNESRNVVEVDAPASMWYLVSWFPKWGEVKVVLGALVWKSFWFLD